MKIRRVFGNVNMGMGHDGLRTMMKEEFKFDVDKMDQGDFVVCINTRRDKAKVLLAGSEMLAYIRPRHGNISLDAIRFLPQVFGAKTGFNYDDAVKLSLEERLAPTHYRPSVEEKARKSKAVSSKAS